MRPIGGEIELQKDEYKSYFTDSGRSSLRLFLRSFDNKEKHYLIPNFLCDVIESIFIQENIKFSFYNVFDDLIIDIKSIQKQEYDVLYVINYFGVLNDLKDINLDDKILLEDNAFLYNFENVNKAKNWYAFNSFRKISPLADGSLIKTTLKIDEKLITKEEAPFVALKYKAKDIKFEYLNQNNSNQTYLALFEEGENMLEKQNDIYLMSSASTKHAFLYDTKSAQYIRHLRLQELYSILGIYCINPFPSDYSFFIIKVDNRDEIKQELKKSNIFLASHWDTKHHPTLNHHVLSIPLFESYEDIEFNNLVDKIKSLIKE